MGRAFPIDGRVLSRIPHPFSAISAAFGSTRSGVQRVSGGQPHRRANASQPTHCPAASRYPGPVREPHSARATVAARIIIVTSRKARTRNSGPMHLRAATPAEPQRGPRTRASPSPLWDRPNSPSPATPRRCEAVRRVKPTARLLKNSNSPFVGALEELLRLAPPALEPLLLGVPEPLHGTLLTAEDSALARLVRCCGGLSGYGCEPEGKQQGHC
jgi:hypothetical protein